MRRQNHAVGSVNFVACDELDHSYFSRILVDLDGVTKHQDKANISRWRVARSTGSVYSDITRLTTTVDDLSATSIVRV